MRDFRFTNTHQQGEVGSVVDFLERPRLWVPAQDYPDRHEWLEKTWLQLEKDQKRAMVAYQGGELVGAVVYQRHVTEPDVLEVKNISVSPQARGRYVASFLLRNAEIEGATHDFPDSTSIVVDTKLSSTGMITFLLKHHYTIVGVDDLYGLNAGLDVVFRKNILNNN